jgi:pentatricopeptide repeat protein
VCFLGTETAGIPTNLFHDARIVVVVRNKNCQPTTSHKPVHSHSSDTQMLVSRFLIRTNGAYHRMVNNTHRNGRFVCFSTKNVSSRSSILSSSSCVATRSWSLTATGHMPVRAYRKTALGRRPMVTDVARVVPVFQDCLRDQLNANHTQTSVRTIPPSSSSSSSSPPSSSPSSSSSSKTLPSSSSVVNKSVGQLRHRSTGPGVDSYMREQQQHRERQRKRREKKRHEQGRSSEPGKPLLSGHDVASKLIHSVHAHADRTSDFAISPARGSKGQHPSSKTSRGAPSHSKSGKKNKHNYRSAQQTESTTDNKNQDTDEWEVLQSIVPPESTDLPPSALRENTGYTKSKALLNLPPVVTQKAVQLSLRHLESIPHRSRALSNAYSDLFKAVMRSKRKGTVESSVVQQVWDNFYARGTPSAREFTTMLSLLGRERNMPKIEELYEKLQLRGIRRDRTLYNTLIKLYGQERGVKEGLAMFNKMDGDRIRPDVYTYATLIDLYASEFNVDKAFETYYDMLDRSVNPNDVVYASLIKALGKVGDTDGALTLLRDMQKRNLYPTLAVYNALIHAHVPNADVLGARRVLASLVQLYKTGIGKKSPDNAPGMRTRKLNARARAGLRPNRATTAALLQVYKAAGDAQSAVRAFKEMEQFTKADESLFMALMDVVGTVGDRNLQASVFEDGVERNFVKPLKKGRLDLRKYSGEGSSVPIMYYVRQWQRSYLATGKPTPVPQTGVHIILGMREKFADGSDAPFTAVRRILSHDLVPSLQYSENDENPGMISISRANVMKYASNASYSDEYVRTLLTPEEFTEYRDQTMIRVDKKRGGKRRFAQREESVPSANIKESLNQTKRKGRSTKRKAEPVLVIDSDIEFDDDALWSESE